MEMGLFPLENPHAGTRGWAEQSPVISSVHGLHIQGFRAKFSSVESQGSSVLSRGGAQPYGLQLESIHLCSCNNAALL